MERYNDRITKLSNYEQIRLNKNKENSKKRLLEISKSKIKTTMIGAIATIEEHLGELLNSNEEFQDIFSIIRSAILDKGNNQARNLETEFANYDIIWQKNSFDLPIINRGQNNDR